MATQINTNQIKDAAVTAAKNSYTPTQVVADVDTFSMLVDNDATETAIMTEEIAAATLGSTGHLTGRIRGWCRNESGGNATFVVRLKYGAETLATTGSITIANGNTEVAIFIDFRVSANAGPAAQRGGITVSTALLDAGTPRGGADDGASTQDSTGALNLVVSWDFSGANAALEYYQYGYQILFSDPG